MGAKDRAEAVNEIRVLASVAGAHIITFFEAFVESDVLYIVTEFATSGDLFGYLKEARDQQRTPPTSFLTPWRCGRQPALAPPHRGHSHSPTSPHQARKRGPLREEVVWSLFIQMLLGLKSLHDRNILHRDLKGANIFMCSRDFIKLGDFGVSKVRLQESFSLLPSLQRNVHQRRECRTPHVIRGERPSPSL